MLALRASPRRHVPLSANMRGGSLLKMRYGSLRPFRSAARKLLACALWTTTERMRPSGRGWEGRLGNDGMRSWKEAATGLWSEEETEGADQYPACLSSGAKRGRECQRMRSVKEGTRCWIHSEPERRSSLNVGSNVISPWHVRARVCVREEAGGGARGSEERWEVGEGVPRGTP